MFLTHTNELLIANTHTVSFVFNDSKPDTKLREAFLAEMAHYNYFLDDELRNKVMTLGIVSEKNSLKSVLDSVKHIIGAQAETAKPLFPMFPDYSKVSDGDLKLLNFFHYLFLNRYEMDNEEVAQYAKTNNVKHVVANEVKLSEYTSKVGADVIASFITSKTIKSSTDRELAKYLLEDDFDNIIDNLDTRKVDVNNVIKENLVFITALLLDNGAMNTRFTRSLVKSYKNPVDVLRLAYNLSGEDLKTTFSIPKFKFSRPVIKYLYKLLENAINADSVYTLKRYEVPFKALGRRIHVTTDEHKRDYPKTALAFKALMNNEIKGDPRYSVYNDLLSEEGHISLLFEVPYSFAKKNPTLFLKNLDALAKRYPAQANDDMIKTLEAVISGVSTLALMQAYRVFGNSDYRPLYFIRNTYFVPDEGVFRVVHPNFNKKVAKLIIEELGKRNTNTERKVFISDALDKITLPVNERTTSSQFAVLPKLSRVAIPDELHSIRTFVYWKNGLKGELKDSYGSRIDLDSSIVAISKDARIEPMYNSWNTSLKGEGLVHSGDIVSAEPNAVEYQDIDLDLLTSKGYDYVIMSVTSFTGQQFSDMVTASTGFMGIVGGMQNSSTWTPENVIQNAQLTSQSTNQVALVVDLRRREVIWVNAKVGKSVAGYAINRDKNYLEVVNRIADSSPITIGDIKQAYFGDSLVTELPNADSGEYKEIEQFDQSNIDFSKMFPDFF